MKSETVESKKKTFKKRTKKAPVKKVSTDPVDFDQLVGALKADAECFIPEDETDTLVEVQDWIPMPKPLCEVMGTQGLPCGHVVEMLGPPDSGKTTACTHALIGAQQSGGIAILIDTEHKFNFERAEFMGLDRKRLIIYPVDTIEDVFDRLVNAIKKIKSKDEWKDRKVVVVWDSIGSTPCRNELDESTKDHNMKAAQALKGGLRRTRYFLTKTNVSFLMINQVYKKQTATPFQKQTTSYGGFGPEYFSSIRMEFVQLGKLQKTVKGKKEKIGITSQVEVLKNHLAPPFKKGTIEIDRKGIVFERKAEM